MSASRLPWTLFAASVGAAGGVLTGMLNWAMVAQDFWLLLAPAAGAGVGIVLGARRKAPVVSGVGRVRRRVPVLPTCVGVNQSSPGRAPCNPRPPHVRGGKPTVLPASIREV
jgi:hypothetical protein